MAKREQLGEEQGQNDMTGSGNTPNGNQNGKRLRGDGAMILAAAAQPPLQQPRRPFMAFSGTRHTRVGADYQVTHLPSPSMTTTTTTTAACSKAKVDTAQPA
jgi:hypothetical protein